jgi:hypothetical protein
MRFTIIIGLFFFATGCQGQSPPEVRQVLEASIDHAASASMYRDTVDWESLRKEMSDLSQHVDSVSGLVPAMNLLFERLGDEHARFIHNNRPIAFFSGPDKEHHAGIDWNVYGRIQSGQSYTFSTELITPTTGYVRLVGLPMGDNEQMSREIQSAVCDEKRKGAIDWIVDLRYNGGGNMFPMVEGLAAIIGDGPAGGAVGLTAAENSVWRVEDTDFYYDDYSVQLKDDCPYDVPPKVAVLTSMYTASSGEVVAVVFKGRDKTRFFGEPTHGLTTVNDWTVLDSTSFLLLSVGTYKSRDAVVHNEFVAPDEYVTFIPDVSQNDDPVIRAALGWLRND